MGSSPIGLTSKVNKLGDGETAFRTTDDNLLDNESEFRDSGWHLPLPVAQSPHRGAVGVHHLVHTLRILIGIARNG